jgi:integrase
MDRRERGGIRGIVSERHRFGLHVSTARFASEDVGAVRSRHVREWLREMQAKKAADTRGDRTLSNRTVARSFALVSAIFTAAVEDELIEANPCIGVRLSKKADERETEEKWTYLTVDEQRALTTCEAVPHEHRVAIRFAIATGLRQGEQMNLPIADVHLSGPEPYVHVRFGSPGLPPKSGKPRKVPLFGDGLSSAREAVQLAEAVPFNPDGLVFPTPHGKRRGVGKPLGRVKVGGRHVCAWKHALRTAGVRNHKWHGLRHTCATNLVTGALGRRWTLEEIQPLMGHSSITITQIYAKVGDDALKRAARETVAVVDEAHGLDVPVDGWVWVRRFRERAGQLAARLTRVA